MFRKAIFVHMFWLCRHAETTTEDVESRPPEVAEDSDENVQGKTDKKKKKKKKNKDK